MDLSMLPTQGSEYDKQKARACFTVRSANSPSYSLTRRPGIRKPRGFSDQERESTKEVDERERYGPLTGTNGTNTEEDRKVTGYQARTESRSSVKDQCEEKETSGHKRSTKLNQNGTADKTIKEFGTDRNRNCNPASESRGRTLWRGYDLSYRSKSLDWRTGDTSPERGKMADMSVLSTKRGLDERRTGVEGVRGRMMSSVQSYNSAGTSNDQERSPGSHMSQTLDRATRGNSLPTRFRCLSGFGSGVLGTASSFGPKGGQSIMERIEKLYGSANFGKMEDCSNIRDFSTPVTCQYRETSKDALVSPQQRSYERASGGTFPRRFSSEERSSPSPVQSTKSFTWTQKDTKGFEISFTPGISRTRERLSGVQWEGQIQSRYSEEGRVNWGRGLEEMRTKSLDRARSRYSVASQIRSARAAAGVTASPQSNTFLEGERSVSLRDLSVLRETELKSSSTEEDVFESNPLKIPIKTIERKKFPERSAASVRNKINQFEALTQRGHGLPTGQVLMPRRAFSVPAQLHSAYDGVKKSGSAKAIGGLKHKWEELKEGKEAGDETGARKRLGSNRSLSVDEVALGLGRKEREGDDLVENQGKETNNYCADDFGKNSRLKSTLEIPLNGGPQRLSRNLYIDETDFHKISSPVEASKRSFLLLSDSSDTSAGVQKTTLPHVTSRVGDDDKTPTNSVNNSPFLSPTTQPEIAFLIAETETENTSVIAQATKTPERHSPLPPHPLASSSHSNLPDLMSPDVNTAHRNGKKQLLDLEAWVAGLNPKSKVWNDEEDDYEDDDDDDDDESTQRDEDSNYDSDSGESSVTITSNMSQSDHKSFCVSLSDLCNFGGVDYESENVSNVTNSRTASLSSDMSALSCVSVMPSEELDRLLEDVRSVGDSTLQDYDDVQVVVLHKDMGVGLGFSVAGGVDQNKPVTVHKVFHSGVAAQEGSIREGDQVLSINGTALRGYAHWEALRVLRRAKTREMGVVVLRRGEISSVRKRGGRTNNEGPTQTPLTETGQLLCVRLEKNSRDLGFSLEGGVDSNLENRPLTVQKIFQGGPVDKMYPGDEVEEIEGMSVVGMRRLEAWTLIRRLPPGPVDVVLRRPLKHLET
ncbi:uncharacterized protein LOC115021779 [Cottoperca gobio]|uniref:Uncharacterized protein LOC115021779 n=1 Tax=Cottoperca gobio TaxID=56716 RepID=A0A6J2RDP4_COTGO|nr:uncharacterized protein LOC115021779 [Cottoperca gobio]XP_029308292.1 uncharacterized protein LOC115021779 [Cottoperca gobio]XP_029308293.1 uncharacterized protein LOC115021779 [Cottoperca gobio]XP_029308294.1 uncharacterized protein LOC115021779 [Cottoperca gobio]